MNGWHGTISAAWPYTYDNMVEVGCTYIIIDLSCNLIYSVGIAWHGWQWLKFMAKGNY